MTPDKPATRWDMAQLDRDVKWAADAYQWKIAKRSGFAERTIGYDLQSLKISYKNPRRMSRHVATCKNKIAAYEAEDRTIVYLNDSGLTQNRHHTHCYFQLGKR